jgi:type IV pilus assembly protein PilO
MEQLLERINKLALPAKAGILAAIVVATTAGCYFGLISDIEDQIDALKAKQAGLVRTLAEKQEIADNLNDRRREMDQLDQRLQDALTELPERKDMDELLAQLNDVGKKAGLEITKIVPGAEAVESFYAKIPVSMSVVGNYHEIAVFLQEVSNMRRIVNINNLKLSVKSAKNEKVILGSDFLATTFRFNDSTKSRSR